MLHIRISKSTFFSCSINKICLIFCGLRQWHPTPVLLPGKSHGRRSLEGCRPWGRWGSDTTEWLHFHLSLSCIGEGNGNPLQRSCLENPRDGGAWWAAVCGVAQNRTRLKWFSKWYPWMISCQAPVFMRFSRQESWSELQCPPPGYNPNPGTELTSLASPALQTVSLPLSHWGSPIALVMCHNNNISKV